MSSFSFHIQESRHNYIHHKHLSTTNLHSRPLLNPHHTLKRLPQEALPGLQLALIQIKIISPERGRDNKRQFHLGHVPADATPRAVRERDEARLLPLRQGVPPLRLELVGVGAPDLLGVVDRVRRHREHRVGREVVAEDLDARAGGHDAREAERRCRVDAHALPDTVIQVRQILDHLKARHVDLGRDGVIELFLQLGQNSRGFGHVVQDGAGRVGRRVRAGDELRQGFGRQLLAAHGLALVVLAFHEAREQVHTSRILLPVQALRYARDGDTSKVLHGGDALAEEGVG